ncbi:type VI secretion system lipoprotein TssJ [Vibrio tubiashii]|uniref:type VI secretion system lipoprotein TssJ n=1 Tax=Vibrio tubiashii TaxID=29498 RepID=UPI001EFED348|nr:type VI secretion system lipoprotein TssJ [Vibrio tubiashii]MCG9582665.1 type VI secretion system lipoprotein TssJ [Vibrio tubiashii]MCG9616258.1 type VI secretion system lipoprotein TssJ [Vibrio tubiashii]MCG9687831.1 type VI secretion system lipoprotein TssJ [Vibrio tubiashii]
MRKWYLAAVLLLAGCSSDPVPVVSQYNLTIKSDAAMNPSDSNTANPVVVRLYQLTDVQMFKQVPFIDLYSNDVQLLSANLVSKQVLPVILPDTSTEQVLDINKTTQYVAVVVEFVDYQNSETKAFSTLPVQADQYLQLNIQGAKASLEIVTPESSWWQVF